MKDIVYVKIEREYLEDVLVPYEEVEDIFVEYISSVVEDTIDKDDDVIEFKEELIEMISEDDIIHSEIQLSIRTFRDMIADNILELR